MLPPAHPLGYFPQQKADKSVLYLRKVDYEERCTTPPFLQLFIFLPNSTHPLSQ